MNKPKKERLPGEMPLREVPPCNSNAQIIGRIASSFYYIPADTMVHDLADTLNQNDHIHAVGVVNDECVLLGIIPRRELLSILSQPFGRDLNKNRTVTSIMIRTATFQYQENIFTVAEHLKDDLNWRGTRYYGLVDSEGVFTGIFSNMDLHIYLSDLTQRDINMAKNLQSCVVKDLTTVSGDTFEATGATRMAQGIGGDYYAMREYLPGKWFFSICDVSGKGVPAALLSVTIGGMEKLYDFARGFPEYIQGVNAYIFNTFGGERFVTGIYIDYHQQKNEMSIYNFGHSYIYLLRDETFREIRLKNGTIPLGIKEKINPSGGRFPLKKDDLIVVITDGMEEQRNPHGEEFSLKRIVQIIKKEKNQKNEEIIRTLFNKVKNFRKNMTQHDDISIILIRILK